MRSARPLILVIPFLVAALSACGGGGSSSTKVGVPVTAKTMTVQTVTPANAAATVVLNQVVEITFSEDIDPVTMSGSSVNVTTGAVTVPGALALLQGNAKVVQFTPAGNYGASAAHTVTVTTGLRSTAGAQLANTFTSIFTTAGAGVTAAGNPTIIADGVDPKQKDLSAAPASVKVTLSQSALASSVTATTFIVESGGNAVAGARAVSGADITFTPTGSFPDGVLTIKLTNGVKGAGNATLTTTTVPAITTPAGGKALAFSASAANIFWEYDIPDTTAPTLLGTTSPKDKQKDLPISSFVTLRFSEPLDSSTVRFNDPVANPPGSSTQLSIYLVDKGSTSTGPLSDPVPILAALNGPVNDTITMRPQAGVLENDTTYEVRIGLDGTIRDLAANALGGVALSFTTVSAFKAEADMPGGRFGHTATRYTDSQLVDRVLVAGGFGLDPTTGLVKALKTTAIYTISATGAAGTWAAGPSMSESRGYHTASKMLWTTATAITSQTLTQLGPVETVLLIGGLSGINGPARNDMEVFVADLDNQPGAINTVPVPLNNARGMHTATVVRYSVIGTTERWDVVVAGGCTYDPSAGLQAVRTIELLGINRVVQNGSLRNLSLTLQQSNMNIGRFRHSATFLPPDATSAGATANAVFPAGAVVLAGGSSDYSGLGRSITNLRTKVDNHIAATAGTTWKVRFAAAAVIQPDDQILVEFPQGVLLSGIDTAVAGNAGKGFSIIDNVVAAPEYAGAAFPAGAPAGTDNLDVTRSGQEVVFTRIRGSLINLTGTIQLTIPLITNGPSGDYGVNVTVKSDSTANATITHGPAVGRLTSLVADTTVKANGIEKLKAEIIDNAGAGPPALLLTDDALTTANVSYRLTWDDAAGIADVAKFIVTFPVGFTVATVAAIPSAQITSPNGSLTGAFNTAVSGQVLTITRAGGGNALAVPAPGAVNANVQIQIAGITNPATISGQYRIQLEVQSAASVTVSGPANSTPFEIGTGFNGGTTVLGGKSLRSTEVIRLGAGAGTATTPAALADVTQTGLLPAPRSHHQAHLVSVQAGDKAFVVLVGGLQTDGPNFFDAFGNGVASNNLYAMLTNAAAPDNAVTGVRWQNIAGQSGKFASFSAAQGSGTPNSRFDFTATKLPPDFQDTALNTNFNKTSRNNTRSIVLMGGETRAGGGVTSTLNTAWIFTPFDTTGALNPVNGKFVQVRGSLANAASQHTETYIGISRTGTGSGNNSATLIVGGTDDSGLSALTKSNAYNLGD